MPTCLNFCLPYYLPDRVPAYLPAGLPKYLPVCLPKYHCVPAYLPA